MPSHSEEADTDANRLEGPVGAMIDAVHGIAEITLPESIWVAANIVLTVRA